MKNKIKQILSFAMCLILLIGMLPVNAMAAEEEAQPYAPPSYGGYYDHIDVRQEGASISMTYITRNMVTGELISKRDVTIECTVSAIKSVSYTERAGTENEKSWTWTSGFSNDGSGYEFRKMNLRLSRDLSGSYATIVVDLTDKDGNLYEDVTFSFGPAGCQKALEDCDGYTGGNNFWGMVGLDFMLGKNDGALVEYTNWVIPVKKVWDDNANQDGIRPESVQVQLYANGEAMEGMVATLSERNNWYHEFKDLEGEDAEGKTITYTIQEVQVPNGYTATVDNKNFTVTNIHIPATTSVSGSKTWEDAENQDGKRPGMIVINLLANGKVVATKEVGANDNWAWTFDNLPKFEAGQEIVYSIVEEAVEGYTTTYNGYDVINTHAPEQTSVTVTKAWEDAGNQDGIRPNSVTVVLLANGERTNHTLTLNAANNWTGSFVNLPKFEAGQQIAYSVVELEVPGYTSAIAGSAEDGFVITNTHTPETTSVSGSKTWNDAENQDGARPDYITIKLMAAGQVVDTKRVTANDNWSWTFENLPKYAAGEMIVYSIVEEAVEGYTTTYNGYNVINSYTPAEVSITVNKAWEDAANQDGIRPNEVTVILLVNGEPSKHQLVLNAGNQWTGSFTDLPKFKAGEEIVYSIMELEVPGYTSVIDGSPEDGFVITNTHTPETTSVSGSKTWNDAENQDGARPDSITVNLLANGKVVATKTVTANDNWSWTFENLPKNEAGVAIVYSITEEAVEGYTTSYNGFNVTNSYTPAEVSITVNKIWEDAGNQDGIRPNEVILVLLANGDPTDHKLVLNAGNQWTGSFTGLAKFEAGEEIVYTIEELKVAGYDVTITGNAANGFTVTNTHNPETTSVSGSKTWSDAENQDGARPESITINLLANGKVVATKTVTEEDKWAWTFDNLPKYETGVEIAYSITEEAVEGYTTTYNGFNVTNSYTPAEISITVTKVWTDSNNQDGIRPNDVVIKLLANGKATDHELVLSSGNNWTDSFVGLDKFANGQEIVYTIEELEVEGYSVTITGDMAKGFTVTNTHNPETVSISGAKTWEDADNQDGVRPESITINVLANGKVVATKTVTAEEKWAWTFENLPKFDAGVEIVYTISEEAVEGYVTSYDGYNVTNKYDPEKISITVTKGWEDNNDQDGIRPDEITVVLLANGEPTEATLTLTAEDNWTGTFEDLDKFEAGEEIVYTIEELEVEGYATVITGTVEEGFVITNSHTPETIKVEGRKIWEDNNNQDGIRPESISINLLANGKVVATKAVTEEDNWAWTFENLPKFDAGVEIVYTITEEAVEGYVTSYEGFNVINKYDPAKININVTKAWVDSNDGQGIRPDSVTIHLFANGNDTGLTLVLTSETEWRGAFENLPKYAGGQLIEYTITEDDVKGYNAVIKGTAEDGFLVTNSHTYIPQTGDERNPMIWVSMMSVSLLIMVLGCTSFFTKKRRAAK